MLRVLHGDVSSAARALLQVPPGRRAVACAAMLARAERAERHVRATGRAHPRHGNGSLMAVATRRALPPEPDFDDPDYRACFIAVLQALGARTISRSRSRCSG